MSNGSIEMDNELKEILEGAVAEQILQQDSSNPSYQRTQILGSYLHAVNKHNGYQYFLDRPEILRVPVEAFTGRIWNAEIKTNDEVVSTLEDIATSCENFDVIDYEKRKRVTSFLKELAYKIYHHEKLEAA